jgi:hexosaminidase
VLADRGGPGAAAAAAVTRVLNAISWPPGDPRDVPGGDGDDHGPDVRCHDPVPLTVDLDAGLPDEGYRLLIGPTVIRVAAGGPAGAYYAAQSIRQLLPDAAWRSAPVSGPAWTLPCAEISDAPALPWRGAHLDVARNFVRKRDVLELIDALAAVKLNRFHLHLTDDQGWRIESRAHPRLHEVGSVRSRTRISLGREQPPVYDDSPHGGYYSLDDLAEIGAYAAERMITVVPEIELPGHASALLAAMPELGAGEPPPGGYRVGEDWGISSRLLAPLPATTAFLRELFAELRGVLTGRYVHIGGDECVLDEWRADPRIDARRRELGLATAEELHARFMREVADLLADEFGARAVVWDEGFASGAGTPGGALRPDTIVMAWRGGEVARRAAEAGHEVIMTPVMPTYFDYYQENDDREPVAIGGPVRTLDVAGFQPVPADWPEPVARRVLGTQFQVWTEYIRDVRSLEYMMFPRAYALAEVAWSGGPAPWPELSSRLAAQLGRLDAAGIEYRPLDGPRPWQQGGTGPRRHRPGYRIAEVSEHLDQLAATPGAT